MSYKKLDIYDLASTLFLEVHPKTLQLPKHELYELGSQLRRSAHSIVSNIVEGYVRRRYKNEFIRFLVFAHASNDETLVHLQSILKLYPEHHEVFQKLTDEYNVLGSKINKYIQYVEKHWLTP